MTLLARLTVPAIWLGFVLNFVIANGAATPVTGKSLIYPRDERTGCIMGCSTDLSCNCQKGEICSMIAQSCTECARMMCQPNPNRKKKVSGGVIAGASIGAFMGAGFLAFLVYRLCAKKRGPRRSMAATAAEKENDFGMLKSARASTHTVASIASTVRTRASNIIQIAYIPGVTNRSAPASPAHLVPPIPPLPYTDSPQNSQFPRTPNMDIQFAADDLLRGSMYTVNDNRSSIATTIYGGNAVVSQPNIIRAGKAAVVTVKGGSSVASAGGTSPSDCSPLSTIPPVPALNLANIPSRKGESGSDAVPPSPAFSVGTTFLSRVGKDSEPQKRAVPGRSRMVPSAVSTTCSCDDGDLVPGHRGNVLSTCTSCITDFDATSPFSDVNSVVIETAMPVSTGRKLENKRSSRTAELKMEPVNRAMSPFDDSNSLEKEKR